MVFEPQSGYSYRHPWSTHVISLLDQVTNFDDDHRYRHHYVIDVHVILLEQGTTYDDGHRYLHHHVIDLHVILLDQVTTYDDSHRYRDHYVLDLVLKLSCPRC